MTSSVRHGGNSVVVWACMTAGGNWSLAFIDNVTVGRSSRMNSEVYRAMLSPQIKPNAAELIGWCFTVQMDNDPNHTVKETLELFKGKEIKYPSMTKSVKLPKPN